MKKHHYLLILLVLLVIPNVINGQGSNISFSYDDNGNRVSRTLETLKSAKVTFPLTENMFKEDKVEEDLSGLSIHVYPNPNSGLLLIEIHSDQNSINAIYTIQDLNGAKLINGKINSQTMELDLSDLKNGLYILRIIYKNETNDWKIIKSGY